MDHNISVIAFTFLGTELLLPEGPRKCRQIPEKS